MYLKIEELKGFMPSTVSMKDYAASLNRERPTVIFRNYDEPQSPPYLQSSISTVFDFANTPRPAEDVQNAFGERKTVEGIKVINSITAALGPGGYQFHIADGSYAEYSKWDVQEYIQKFYSTDLRVWIAETFDCDDFAQVLQGNVNQFFPGIAFGTIWYGDKIGTFGHAVNIFYDYQDDQTWLVEPQDDSFYLFDKELWDAWVVIL